MPSYDYRCPNCGWRHQPRLKPGHDPPTCFHCDTEMVQVLHPPGLQFLGEGWTEKGDER
jgi:putative FmdB family regulatory protein